MHVCISHQPSHRTRLVFILYLQTHAIAKTLSVRLLRVDIYIARTWSALRAGTNALGATKANAGAANDSTHSSAALHAAAWAANPAILQTLALQACLSLQDLRTPAGRHVLVCGSQNVCSCLRPAHWDSFTPKL